MAMSEKYSKRWKACGSYAHLATVNGRDAQQRVEDIREMMKEKYGRQYSGNLYHAYRKMAHYSKAVDPHSKCVYPHHLAGFLNDLGVAATEVEACRLLHRELSVKSLRQPFGVATFYAVATGKEPNASRRLTRATSGPLP